MLGIYQILWLFFIYSFLGWCVEVIWCGISEGHFINRGFLNGPVCPIYGFGAVAVILCLTPIKNTILLFFASMIITSALELITGFVLEKIYHTRWWDYSDIPFNIGGYICLKYSIYWGFACIALMKGLHPLVYAIVHSITKGSGIFIPALILFIFFAALFITDFIITVVSANNLTKRLKLMEEITAKIHAISDDIGEHIYDTAASAVKKGEELAELKKKYAGIAESKSIFQKRIITAFPHIKSHHHGEHLEHIKQKLRSAKK